MKRILSMLLLTVMLLGLLSGCKEEKTDTPPKSIPAKLWYGYNTERFMRDTQYPEEMGSRDYTLRMQGIRGDVESIQLMITPDQDVTSYHFTANDLSTKDGKKLSADKIEVLSQWYVNVESSYNSAAGYGYYPDALVPMAALKRERLNTIRAGENQGIWLNVTIPTDAAPGTYTGSGVLTLNQEKIEIPIELTVYDAVMPETVHTRSCFLIWYDYMLKAEGSSTGAIAQSYYDLLVEKRCMPMYPSPEIYSDYETYIDWAIANVVNNPKVSTYALPYSYHLNENEKRIVTEEKVMEMLTLMAEKNVELRQKGDTTTNLFAKAYYYLGSIIDEPTGEAIDRVRVCDEILSRCKFSVAEAYLKEYEDLYLSLVGLPHIVTTAYNEELLGSDTEGGVHTWCPQFQHWHTQEQRDQYYDRQNTTDRLMGEEAWWYGCNNPRAPFPTYHVDDDLIGSRVLSWMQFDYGSEGNLYWCVNFSQDDMWENAYDIGGAVGEGNLTYPAKKFGLSAPLSTLRLESIREGCEDYEYFFMMEEAIVRYNVEKGKNYNPKELMAPLYEGLYDGMIPTRGKPQLFWERRAAVLEILQTILKDPAAGIAALEEMQ